MSKLLEYFAGILLFFLYKALDSQQGSQHSRVYHLLPQHNPSKKKKKNNIRFKKNFKAPFIGKSLQVLLRAGLYL